MKEMMKNQISAWLAATGVSLAVVLAIAGLTWAQGHSQAIVLTDDHHDLSPPLDHIPPIPPQAGTHRVIPLRIPHAVSPAPLFQGDPVLQQSTTPNVATTSGLNILGVGVGLGSYSDCCAPPDTNGAAGATQFVQWVNLDFAVFDKSTGALKYGPAAGNTLWTGFGGPCETNNSGDPIAQYDKAAGRWVMMQPVFTNPYYLCVAISTTSDATGSFYRYAFAAPNNNFPDYPKLGVWSDAYYMSFNMFQGNAFVGAGACALDRSNMLIGNPATMQCFLPSSSFASLLPSDVDGLASPPAGSPAFFLNLDSNSLDLWKFHVDFTTPANSTLTGPTNIPVAAFSEACAGGTCIPQSGTSQKLDSLGDRLMYRLAYRNFGSYESLVVTHSVNTGAGNTGVRWYELRNPSGTPTVNQQGTFAPDSNFRWMGSIATDKAGDMAVGYSVSSSTLHPSIRYTGRVPSDPLGTMEAESTIINGMGSQLRNLNRWGDYSSMAVDPNDDCTFWYTTEYLQSNGTFNWSTRIASFSFASCAGSPTFSTSGSPSSQTVTQGSGTSYTTTVSPAGGFTGNVSLSASGLPSGATASFSPNPVSITGTSSVSSTMSVSTSSTTPAGTYTLTITGTSGSLSNSTTVSLVVQAAPTPDFSVSASPGSQTVTQGSGTSYTAAVSPSGGFTGNVSLSASGLPSGATASFSPNPVSITGTSSVSSTMSVSTSSTTPAGTYTLTITGTSGSLVHTTTVTLVVSAPTTGDFSISASPTTRNVAHGASTSYSVAVSSSGGLTGDVTLSVTGLPSNTAASFSPNPVAGGSGSSTLTISTTSTTPTGSYGLTITGMNGSLSHSVNVNLNVR